MPVGVASVAGAAFKAHLAVRSGLTLAKGVEIARALLSADPPAALQAEALALKACFRQGRGAVETAYKDILSQPHAAAFRDDVEAALACLPDLAAALPDAAEMMARGYSPESYAEALADTAVAQDMEVFAAGEARAVLTRCVEEMFRALDRDTAFVAAVERVKWAEAYGRLGRIEAKQDVTNATLAEILAEVRRLAPGERTNWEAVAQQAREKLGATENVVAGFFSTILERDVPPDQFEATFQLIAADYGVLRDELRRRDSRENLLPQLQALRDDAARTLDQGHVDEASHALAKLQQREKEERLREQDRLARLRRDLEEGERHEAALADGELATMRLRIRAAHITLDHAEAARLTFEEIKLTTPPEERFMALRTRRDAFYLAGRDKGLNVELERAIALAKIACREAAGADQLGVALNDLGLALNVLGERESGTARLEEAVAAFRAALEERTRARVPLDWAGTQNNLGAALATLGERESGTARLEEAVAAFRAALEEWTRTRVPFYWATTQNNLGNALQALGEHESGTARMEEAVAAFRAALEEWTRARVPLDWATTQNNLGNALTALGERESGTARLEEAVAAYRAALQERMRARVPLDWAMTQNNLGAALQALGARESGTARLEEAIAAYRAALEAWTRTRVPLNWAGTQNNLGNALTALGERESGTARLEEAVEAYRTALEEFTRARVPLSWAMTQNNLGNALQALSARESGTARLEDAVAAYRAALEEFTPQASAHYHGVASRNLARAEALLAARRATPPSSDNPSHPQK